MLSTGLQVKSWIPLSGKRHAFLRLKAGFLLCLQVAEWLKGLEEVGTRGDGTHGRGVGAFVLVYMIPKSATGPEGFR